VGGADRCFSFLFEETTKTGWLVAALSVLFPIQSDHAADNLKAFPPAKKGMIRVVLQLPAQEDERLLKVELIKELMRFCEARCHSSMLGRLRRGP
jgi:serine protease inhibitor ecotin